MLYLLCSSYYFKFTDKSSFHSILSSKSRVLNQLCNLSSAMLTGLCLLKITTFFHNLTRKTLLFARTKDWDTPKMKVKFFVIPELYSILSENIPLMCLTPSKHLHSRSIWFFFFLPHSKKVWNSISRDFGYTLPKYGLNRYFLLKCKYSCK